MKIVRLTAENIKRIKVVEVVPDGKTLVVIGGKNDAGKSSLLDAIEMAMGGESATPPQPVRKGQKAAKVVLDLGDLVVTRTYTDGGGRKLIVANKDGARFPSPQAMLDRLYGSLSFDPLAFERQDQREQAETLRKLVGLDMSDLDGKRIGLYEERTAANREVKALEVNVDSLTVFEDAPAEEVSIAALAAELEQAEALKGQAALREAKVRQLEGLKAAAGERRQAVVNEMTALKKRLADLEVALEEADADMVSRDEFIQVATLEASEALGKVPDTSAIRARLAEAEQVNVKVRANTHRAWAEKMLAEARAVSQGLTDRIQAIDDERAKRLAAAAFPVPGLGIDDDGVTLNGLPFEQASTSDRIRVSVAIGMASNPTFKVLLVRDGSLLGAEKLAILGEMAKAADAQVWLEMLQEQPDGRTSVFIEDGSVKAAATS